MKKQILLLYFLVFSILLLAQGTDKIQTFRIYSGEYCMFPKHNFFVSCQDTVSYGLTINQIQPVKHISELVMFENQEFWLVQNSMYPQHKDSLLFFTGVWKVDGVLFRLDFDSLTKPLKHFKKTEYRPQYFKKPFVRNYCALDTFKQLLPHSIHIAPYYIDLPVDSSYYRNINSDICTITLPKYIQIPIQADNLGMVWFIFGEYDRLNYNIFPILQVPLVYSQPIKLVPRN